MSSPGPGPSSTCGKGHSRRRGGPCSKGEPKCGCSVELGRITDVPVSDLPKVRGQRATKKKLLNKMSDKNQSICKDPLSDAPPSKKKRVSPKRVALRKSAVTSRMQHDAAPPPRSGGSLSSAIDVPTLSSAHRHRTIKVEINIEQCSGEEHSGKETGTAEPVSLSAGGSVVKLFDEQGQEVAGINCGGIVSVCTAAAAPASVRPEADLYTNFTFVNADEEEELNGVGDWDDDDAAAVFATIESQHAVLPHSIAPHIRTSVTDSDAAHDASARQIVTDMDMLFFDWSNEPDVFKGVREQFLGHAGPTFPLEDMHSPLDIFRKIWDVEFIDHIVTATNRYADQVRAHTELKRRSRYRDWVPTTRDEMLTFFSLLMIQSLVILPVEKDYFKTSGRFAITGIATIMNYSRFILLKRFLHFADESTMPAHLKEIDERVFKVKPLVDFLNDKFMTLYSPGQCIVIDESLLQCSGRFSFIQTMALKAAETGLRTIELCESMTGFLWKFIIYGVADKKGHKTQDEQTYEQTQDWQQQTDRRAASGHVEPDGTAARIVNDLVTPLLGRGHTLVMDNNFNSLLLARWLKSKGFCDVLGKIGLNREFVPESLKALQKQELRDGEVVFSQTEDLTMFAWMDANPVSLISTFHPVEVGMKQKQGTHRYKPQAVLDYNTAMGGVDKKDRLLSAYPMERSRNQGWHKKLFRRLLNVSIMNAYIMYHYKDSQMSQRSFRHSLVDGLLASVTVNSPCTEVKVLSLDGKRPILSGNHFVGKGPSRVAVCVWCNTGTRRSRTAYICKQCNVALCLDICFEQYHTVLR